MAKAVTLATLPNELLDAVCLRLNRRSRYALALTCKATISPATAALYRTYTNRSIPSEAPFHLFLRTVCESPKLAALVKEVDIRGWRSELEVATGAAWRPMETPSEKEDENPARHGPRFTSTDRSSTTYASSAPTASTDLFQLFLNTAVKLGLVAMPASADLISALKTNAQMGTTLEADADLVRQLKHGVEDAHFILMIAQLPQLENLLIDGLTPYPILDWHHFFSRSSGALQYLKILNLRGSTTVKDGKVVKTTLQILDILPNLERLQLQNISAQDHRHIANDTLPSKKLRTVSFHHCAVRHRLLKKIADGQRIRSFLYLPGGLQISVNNDAFFSEKQIAGHLESSKRSLRSLTLYPIVDSGRAYVRDYDGLERLVMPYPGLIPVLRSDEDPAGIEDLLRGRLPDSLKELVLDLILHVHVVEMTKIALAVAILKLQGGLQRLKTVTLKFYEPNALMYMGQPSLTLDQLRVHIEAQVGETFSEAKLKLTIDMRH